TGSTSAYVGDNSKILNAGKFDLLATDTSAASVTGTVEGGGVGEGRGAKTVATINPTITADIGKNVQGTIAGELSVTAKSIRAEGDSTAKDYGGGGVDVGFSHAIVTSTPTVKAFIDTGSNLTVGGAVTVDAEGRSDKKGNFDNFIGGV